MVIAMITGTYSHWLSQKNGRRSMSRSRTVPPPNAATSASDATPTMSSRFWKAVIIPESADVTTAPTSTATMRPAGAFTGVSSERLGHGEVHLLEFHAPLRQAVERELVAQLGAQIPPRERARDECHERRVILIAGEI